MGFRRAVENITVSALAPGVTNMHGFAVEG